MNKLYFISDIHFGAEPTTKETAKTKLLEQFIDRVATDSDRLFIIGDLFDFWFEYSHVVQKEHFRVISILKSAIDRGIKITYVAGNHDFWLGDFLMDEIGLNIFLDPEFFDYDNKRFFLSHGDGIAKRDKGYRLMKRIFRFTPNIKAYRWLHPDIGIPLAKFVSGSSRKYSSSIDLKDHDDYLEYAETYINQGADFVLMGHRHNPLKHTFKNGKSYINTGDWIHHFTYATYENGDIHLHDLKTEFTALFEKTNR